jgi:hypothetical protein
MNKVERNSQMLRRQQLKAFKDLQDLAVFCLLLNFTILFGQLMCVPTTELR